MDTNFDVSGGAVTWGLTPVRGPGLLGIFLSGLLDKCNRSSDALAAVWLAIHLLRRMHVPYDRCPSSNRRCSIRAPTELIWEHGPICIWYGDLEDSSVFKIQQRLHPG